MVKLFVQITLGVIFFIFYFFQVANLACSISNNEEGVKLVRMAATQIDSLCPQVSKEKSTRSRTWNIFAEALIRILSKHANF